MMHGFAAALRSAARIPIFSRKPATSADRFSNRKGHNCPTRRGHWPRRFRKRNYPSAGLKAAPWSRC